MSEAWNATPGEYPRTMSECFDQGRDDFVLGYSLAWTPSLGPLTLDHKAMGRWRDGWLSKQNETLSRWEDAVNDNPGGPGV